MKITIKDSGGTTRNYSSYYDRTQTPFQYQETFDPTSGRTKTGTLQLYNIDSDYIAPQEDQEIRVYRDEAGTDLIFGGVISQVNVQVVSRTDSVWFRNYTLKLSGYDPYTLGFREVIDYERISVKSGQILVDLLTAYAPWINTSNIEVSSSPTIRRIHIERTKLADVVQFVLAKTGWTFYIDDIGSAYYNAPGSLALNWGLTEGAAPDFFKEFDFETLQPESNVQQVANDITLIGGTARTSPVVETFQFNGVTGMKDLAFIPHGINSSVQIFDAFDQNAIDQNKWYENDVSNKITASSRRLQIASGTSSVGILVSKDLFSRDSNAEVRFAEVEITSFASGKLTVGIHSGVQATAVTNFLHALEFDQSAGTLHTREGATVVNFGAIPIGVGVYAIRILVKSGGGAIYYIQGGRTATAKEYGELGSKSWTKVAETSADTTAFMALAIYCDTAIGATVIQAKASKAIDATVTLLSGGKLGTGAAVGADTVLSCGVEGALDFELDCFIGINGDSPQLNFFTDNLPLGKVRISYYIEDIIRERVTSSSSKTAVDARSSLSGDDGTRSFTLNESSLILESQDARDLVNAYLQNNAALAYSGQFTTDSYRLSQLIPVGNKPVAGQQLSITLPNTWGITATEILTNVTGKDIGGEIVEYQIQFGTGKTTFDRLLLRLQAQSQPDITDTQDAVLATSSFIDSEDISTATVARPASPTFSSASFDGSGVAIAWAAVAGATAYEVRDNLYVGQGQGGSLVYQNSSALSYSISSGNVGTIHKKRAFKFYIWSITSGKYSKYPLVVTVEDPAPVPQPTNDISTPNGVDITVSFIPEVETDITSSGRRVQLSVLADMSSPSIDTHVSKTSSNYITVGLANTTYYFRYGLEDDYTVALGDILWSGVRQIVTGAADFSGTKQFVNNTAPDNATTGLAITSTRTPGGEGYVTYTFNYSQGTNIATHFALVFKIGGGTPSINDSSFVVPARSGSSIAFSVPLPVNALTSFAVIPIAITKGGTTAIGSYQTVVNQVVGGDAFNSYIDAIGSGFVYLGFGAGTDGVKVFKHFDICAGASDITGQGSLSATSGQMALSTLDAELNLVSESSLGAAKKINMYGLLVPRSGSSTPTIGTAGIPWAEVHGTTIYENGSALVSTYGRLNSGNSWSAINDFTGGSLLVKHFSTLAAFKSGVVAMEIATYADSGSRWIGSFDGSNYWATVLGIV